MSKTFNTASPSVPGEHYMIDPLKRINLPGLEQLIAENRCIVLHAPRQTGKATALLALMNHLNQQGRYLAAYANVEGSQITRQDVAEGMRGITGRLGAAAQLHLSDGRLSGGQRSCGHPVAIAAYSLDCWSAGVRIRIAPSC